MVEFFLNYGLFLAKAVTIVVALVLFIALVGAIAQSRQRRDHKGEVTISKLNDFFDELKSAFKHELLSKEELKEDEKRQKKADKEKKKHPSDPKVKRIYVLSFDGDVKASGVENLAQEITAVLTMAREQDEVVIKLESPGGQVHAYGLAASQLERLKRKKIPLTVCVDKVAASGGYMMACTASKIIAAPFAIIGSIGVVAELPNFNRVLKRLDVDYDIYTAGEYKRTVTMLGENTEEGRKKFVSEIEETHHLFKDMVQRHRPVLDIQRVATGEHWYGNQCLDLGLIDAIQTSDDYLFEASEQCDIYEVSYEVKKSVAERIGFSIEGLLSRSLMRMLESLTGYGKRLL